MSGRSAGSLRCPLLMLWTAPPPASRCAALRRLFRNAGCRLLAQSGRQTTRRICPLVTQSGHSLCQALRTASSPQLLGPTPPLTATRGAPLAASLGVLIRLIGPPPLPNTRIHHWVGKRIDRGVRIQTISPRRLEKLGSIFTHRTSDANNPAQSPGEDPAMLHECQDWCAAASPQSPVGGRFLPFANVNRLLMIKDERNSRGAHALSDAQY